ncbi:flagellar biosynthesis protein FlaG [Clostridium botulinum]|uniref:Flagellar biosynthesis protein FlaG n=1 Tax=Clostridium combesii TaxID=39481 RepID=A0A2G7HD31_9CLOT|nr:MULTISPECIES: flagellar protein FlaG [Clostridium]APQ77780.1 flaG family protein [Clostridium botulinum]AUM99987.1 flagellar biosynthesis protein FlaG [Clostridium botulinum]KEI81833.1 flagellar protein FlaG [Clostridium botulinum B2 331]KEI96037.1 flagellar protein FlaG [Clostridium botulinum F 357]MBE1303906.1 flagellar protein FlaG [Clostridium botulinum]
MEVKAMSQGRHQAYNSEIVNSGTDLDKNIEKIKLSEKHTTLDKESTREVKDSVDKLNKLLEGQDIRLEYEIYGKFRDLTIRLIDTKTKEVIKEIPPRKIIDMVAKLCEMAGVLIDEKA